MAKYITKEEESKFNIKYETLLLSEVALINNIIRYLCRKKGKFLRPSLIINIGKCLGNLNSRNYIAASLVEMIHLATLVHDDIVDESSVRRGWPTISRVWKNKISLLLGDYIFSRSLSAVIKLDDIRLIKIVSDAADRLSKGELAQLQNSRKSHFSEESYYGMIRDKTASLFEASCELSARISSENKKDIRNFKKFGESFGMAYQIKDDLDDLLSSERELEKPTTLDLKRNMITLPYIYCLEQLSYLERKVFLRKMKKLSSKNKKKEIVKIVEDFGAINYCENKVREYVFSCRESVKSYSQNKGIIAMVDDIFSRYLQ